VSETSERILDIPGRAYNGVWKAWKIASVGLFVVFVAVLADIARTLRRIEGRP